MATKRTVMTPFGGVVTFNKAEQTAMTPFGGVINAKIVAGFIVAWARQANVIIQQVKQ